MKHDLNAVPASGNTPQEILSAICHTTRHAHNDTDHLTLLQALGLAPDPQADANRRKKAEVVP